MFTLCGKDKNTIESIVKCYMKEVYAAGPKRVKVIVFGDGLTIECGGIFSKYEEKLLERKIFESNVKLMRDELFRLTSDELVDELRDILSEPVKRIDLNVDVSNNQCKYKLSI